MLDKIFNIPKFNEVCNELNNIKELENDSCTTIKVAFLRNITLSPIETYLKYFCLKENINLELLMGEYDLIIPEVLEKNSVLYQFAPEIIVLGIKLEALSDQLCNLFTQIKAEEIQSEKQRIIEFYTVIIENIRQHSNSIILIHNFETPSFLSYGIYDSQHKERQKGTIVDLNIKIQELAHQYQGVYIVDLERIQTLIGTVNYFDYRYWHIGRAPYSKTAISVIATEYMKYFRAIKGKTKKCLVLDCDNTLWGGIIGEDGINNIQIGNTYPGSAYSDLQKVILNFYHRGVILAICSKNNENDVIDVLNNHPSMHLRIKHFSIMKINWKDKVINIKEISKELNIGLDSIVFVDDSEFEINYVKTHLPEVLTLHLNGDPALYSMKLNALGVFDTLTISEEDMNRNQMYKADIERKKVESEMKFINTDDYFKYLEIEVEICFADMFSVPRIAQLFQRTNQFNLTTKRYTENDINEFTQSGDKVVMYVKMKDRFGDYGIIGSVILNIYEKICYIDSFLLSCRVIGRGVEELLLKNCEMIAIKRDCNQIIGLYCPTSKNVIIAEFYKNRKFELTNDEPDKKEYCRSLIDCGVMNIPTYFKNVTFCD